MRKDKNFYLILIAVLMLSGCVTANVVRYPTANYSPTDPSSISVFSDFPPQAYEVIGETEASGAPASNWGSIASGMRSKAATIGGDAVVIIVQDTPFAGTWNTPGRVSGSTYGSSTSTGFLNAYGSGNNIYGNYSGFGSSSTTSDYTITPPSSTPMYGKYAKGFVIKFVRVENQNAFRSLATPRFVKDMNLPPVAVSKIDASGLAGSTFASYHVPSGQIIPVPMTSLTNQQQTDLIAQNAKKDIIDELSKSGYAVVGGTSLFDDDDTSNARFLFGGIAKDLKINMYGYPLPDHAQTESTVEWQIYDKTTKSVIYKAIYTGMGNVDFRVSSKYSASVDSFKFFLSDEKLIEAMRNATKTATLIVPPESSE